MKKTMIIICLLISTNLSAQDITAKKDDNIHPRIDRPVGMSFNFVALAFSIDYFITPNINPEIGAGLAGVFAGAKYHIYINDNKKWTPYLGAYWINTPSGFLGRGERVNGAYIPLGIQYVGDRGFTFGVELAGLILEDVPTPVYGAVKVGTRL